MTTADRCPTIWGNTITLREGHVLTLVEQPIAAGPRFTITCTCGERITTDFAVCAAAAPAIHRFEIEEV